MENSKFMIGVHHRIGYIPQTIRLLQKLELDGKRVMLEIPEYPVKFPIKNKPWRRDASFYLYWKGVADFLVSEGATIIPGNDDEIEREYQKSFQPISHLYTENLRDYCKEYYKIRKGIIDKYIKDKDAHFLEVIADENPDGIILGKTHSLNLKKIIPYSYIGLRTEDKVDELEYKMMRMIPWTDVSRIIEEYKNNFPKKSADILRRLS